MTFAKPLSWNLAAGFVVGLGSALSAGCQPAPPTEVAARPAVIILISVDTLRPDHLGTYGYDRPTSPYIDTLATGATVFESAVSTSSWTLPAHVSLMVSQFAADHGVHTAEQGLSSTAVTLAERLQAAGYRTGGFFSSQLLSDSHGFEQGFDHYERPSVQGDDAPGEALNQAALHWIDSGREPCFLFLHYYDVHAPYRGLRPGRTSFAGDSPSPPSYEELGAAVAERFLMSQGVDPSGLDWSSPRSGFALAVRKLAKSSNDPTGADRLKRHLLLNQGLTAEEQALIIDLYDDGITHQDFLLEQLADELEARGLLEQAMIWLVSDHGEMLYDHHGYRDHTEYLNQAITAVPMIVRLPGQTAGRRVAQPTVSLVDVMPTILDAVGHEVEGHGSSLLPLLQGTGTMAERPLPLQVAFGTSHRRSLLHWPWKLVVDDTGRHAPNLFNVETDPGEAEDQASLQVLLMTEMAAELDRLTGTPGSLAEAVEIDRDEAANLRALGYIE